MRRPFLAVAAALVLLAGCSDPSHPSTAPTTAGGQTPPSPNPDVVPAVITPAYVNAVFAVLNHINGNAVRALVASGSVTPSVEQDLRAIFNDPLYGREVQIAAQSLRSGVEGVRNPPGDRVTTVVAVMSASPSCIFIQTQTSLAMVLMHAPPPAASEYYGLQRKQQGADPAHLNPTPWAISFNATYVTRTTIPDQCAA